jgi:hypothetical protein
MEYLKQISKRLDQAEAALVPGGGQQAKAETVDATSLFSGFANEHSRFDTLDFEPSVRAAFVEQRARIQSLAGPGKGVSERVFATKAREILPLLDAYVGEGTGAVARDFSFVNDAAVRVIVERDYKHLKLKTFPDGAWKSSVTLCGGILEAILFDQLIQDPAKAMAAPRSPKKKGKVPRDITLHNRKNEWTLADFIKVSADLGIISKSNEDSVDEVLREYRNYVHPRVEVIKGISITEGHAMASIGSLEVIIDKLLNP